MVGFNLPQNMESKWKDDILLTGDANMNIMQKLHNGEHVGTYVYTTVDAFRYQ